MKRTTYSSQVLVHRHWQQGVLSTKLPLIGRYITRIAYSYTSKSWNKLCFLGERPLHHITLLLLYTGYSALSISLATEHGIRHTCSLIFLWGYAHGVETVDFLWRFRCYQDYSARMKYYLVIIAVSMKRLCSFQAGSGTVLSVTLHVDPIPIPKKLETVKISGTIIMLTVHSYWPENIHNSRYSLRKYTMLLS